MGHTPLRISTIKPEKTIDFDLYIFFKETYIIYLKSGEALSPPQYQKLKKQKIAKFFITESDEVKYQSFLDHLLDETLSSPDTSVEEKVNITEGAAQNAVEGMQKDPESEKSFNNAKKAASGLKRLILENPDSLKMIFGKKVDPDDLIIKHSLNVSVLATKLGKEMDCSEEELDELAIAGLIHDVGLTKLDDDVQDLFVKNRNDFDFQEQKKYNVHCGDALKLISEKPYITKSIFDLIQNHEETLSGSGPHKKKKLSKLEGIISIVNRYDKIIVTDGITPKEAIKEMMINDLGNYDIKMMKQLKKVLKHEKLLE